MSLPQSSPSLRRGRGRRQPPRPGASATVGRAALLAAALAAAALPAATAQSTSIYPACINTVFGSAGGTTAPTFQYVEGVAVLRGRTYFSDKNGLYVIYGDQTYAKLAGGGATTVIPASGLPPLDMSIVYIAGLAADARRNRIYMADYDCSRIVYLDLNVGLIFNLAGDAACMQYGSGGDGGLATAATLNGPLHLYNWVARDELLIPDSLAHVVRAVNLTSGMIRRVAGSRATPGSSGPSGDGGLAVAANLYGPQAAVPDLDTGVIYVSEGKAGVLRAIAPDGTISTVLGKRGSTSGYSGDDGPAVNATTKYPCGLTIDQTGRKLYMTDYKVYAIRVIDLRTGIVTRVAGEPPDQFGRTGDGGSALLSRLNGPYQLHYDAPSSTLLIAEEGSSVVRAIFANGTINTITIAAKAVAASVAVSASGATTASAATPTPTPAPITVLNPARVAAADVVPENPMEAIVDCTTLDMYMTEPDGNVIRKVTREAETSFVVGTFRTRTTVAALDGVLAFNTTVGRPGGIALDSTRRLLFFIDLLQNRVYQIDLNTGRLSTLTGTGGTSNTNEGGPAKGAGIYKARYMAADSVGGRLFISCDLTHVIRMVDYGGAGTITTIAGIDGSAGYSGDGGPAAAALLNGPFRSGWDSVDQAYIFWDSNTDVIRRIEAPVGGPIGAITTIAGNASSTVTKIPEGGIGAFEIQTAGGDGLAVDSVRRHVYYASTPHVARLDLTTGRISVVAGARTLATGGAAPGVGHPLNFTITSTRFIQPDCLGGFFFKNVFTVMHVTGLDAPPPSTPCPAGYACPCGRRPVPCTSRDSYCPPDTGRTPRNVSNGYAPVVVAVPQVLGYAGGYSSQAPCPVGTYCAAGLVTQCPVGSYGVDDMQMTASAACLQCPAGTYQPLTGLGIPGGPLNASAAKPCRSCPPGTYSKAPGAKSCAFCKPLTYGAAEGATNVSAGCAACPANTWSSVGARTCLRLQESDKASTDATSANFLRLVSFDPQNEPFLLAALSIGIPLLIIFSIPLLSVTCTRFGPPSLRNRFGSILTKVDNTGLAHPVPVGASPVKKPTSLGGGFTVFFIGVFLAVSAVQISQYLRSNTLVQQGLLPVSFGDLAGMTAIPPFSKLHADLQPVAPGVSSGFAIILDTVGPDCATFDDFAIDLYDGTMSGESIKDPASDAVRHVFRCPNCVLSALSELSVWFKPTCTSFAVTAVAIGGWGKVSYSSLFVQDAASVAITFPMGLELVQDSIDGQRVTGGVVYTGGRSARGWQLSPGFETARADLEGTSGPDEPTVFITLPLATTYTQALLKPNATAVQLVSSIVGLLSLLGIAKIIIMLIANARRVKEERLRKRGVLSAHAPDSSSGGTTMVAGDLSHHSGAGTRAATGATFHGGGHHEKERFSVAPIHTNPLAGGNRSAAVAAAGGKAKATPASSEAGTATQSAASNAAGDLAGTAVGASSSGGGGGSGLADMPGAPHAVGIGIGMAALVGVAAV